MLPLRQDRAPDAVNLWIGNGKSVSSIHSGRCIGLFEPCCLLTATIDPYENIYTVIRGRKDFTLLPPTDGWYLSGMFFTWFSALILFTDPLSERLYPHATYVRKGQGHDLTLQPSEHAPSVRWASISDQISRHLPSEAHPIHVSISEGEMLYLPVGWFHEVRQAECGITIALNWWYDACMRGHSWVLLSYLRAIKDVPPGNVDEDESMN